MKRNLTLVVVVCILFGFTACTAAAQSDGASHPSPRRVATALEHLTVLEYEEPVAQAAAGSSAFQIERQDNKVFIKPLRPNASTNLFVWTASSQQFSYELSVTEVAVMDAAIHVTIPRLAPLQDGAAKLEQATAMAVTRTLLGMEQVDSSGLKLHKNGIAVRIEEVFRDKTTLFIRYSLENRTKKSYRIATPALYELRTEHPGISLASLKDKQLDERTIKRLRETGKVAMPSLYDSTESEIAPGASKQGLIAVHPSSDRSSPMVVQVVFTAKAKATIVL